MGSSGKKRTTMAKLNRESKLRDKRADKEARKVARKLIAAHPGPLTEPDGEAIGDQPVIGDTVGVATSSDEGAPAPDAEPPVRQR